jgi:glutamate/tyrosine decarboxylase-like PLP-dependent enzyme
VKLQIVTYIRKKDDLMKNKYVSDVLEQIRNKSFDGVLELSHQFALDYINNVDHMPVFPDRQSLNNLEVFYEDLSDAPESIESILEMLHKYGSPATVAQTGGRYFGFVNGGILPQALATKWLTDAWDQNPALYVISPISAVIEEITERWLIDLLDLPEETVAGYVSGTSTATIIGLTTGRNYLLDRLGYDIFGKGLFNAPELKIVIGAGAHSTVYKALSIIGLGNKRIIKVPCDDQGRMIKDKMPLLDNKTLLILQAGNVNTGSFDDFEVICKTANDAGAYVHVDGAFGLWTRACKELKQLTKGIENADSWSADGHKTLNSPYDNGLIFCKHKECLVNSMHMVGSYIILSDKRDNMLYTAEMSRRARAIDLWATLKGLGKEGVSQLVYELHRKAVYFGEALKNNGLEIINDIVFNQVLVRYDSDEKTERLIKKIQQSGVLWLGGAKWKGNSVMRISISSYKTTYDDIDLSVKTILDLVNELKENQ